MAGHSHWAGIKHKKGKADKQRSAIFSKLSREITVAAKLGDKNPDMNARLRSAIETARSANMPKDNIERVIKKAEDGENSNLEEIRYEGYAPGGVALIVDALTDNRNRTAAEVRSSFTKYGGNLGETGSVSFMFNNVGQIVYKKNIMSEDEIFDIAIEVGANDVKADENNYEIITSVNEFNNVREKLEDILGGPDQAELIWYPENNVQIDDERKATSILKLLDTLDNCEDVQGVYANFEINDDIIKKINL